MNKQLKQIEPCLHQFLADLERHNASSSLIDFNQLGVDQLATLFEDSSCELWRLSIAKGYLYIKLEKADQPNPPQPFWLMMQVLFDMSLADALKATPVVSDVLSSQLNLQVPHVYESFNLGNRTGIVLSEVKGKNYFEQNFSQQINAQDNVINSINNANIKVLAEYLGVLHSNACIEFGGLNKVNLRSTVGAAEIEPVNASTLFSWQEKLAQLFALLDKEQQFNFDKTLLLNLKISRLVPVMMDLRWDQFAFQNGELRGVYDLDAYVAAPIELDFVILEYLLDNTQLDSFVKAYKANTRHSIPKISAVRTVYRHLFFLVNALGEADYKKWMAHPHYFK